MADGKVVIDVILDDGSVAKGVANVDKSLSGLGESAKSSARKIGEIATALGLVALAKKGIDLVRDSIHGAFQRIDTMEQFERVMNVMIDDTDAVAASMDRLQDIVEGTSMRTDVMANGIQNFVTRGMEIDQATDTVEAWGNAVAFYGNGSNEQFENVADALQNMVAKGKVGMDQLNRLYDSGIPAVEMYADAVGMEVGEVQDALSNGEISAEDFVNTVTDSLMKGTSEFPSVAGAMEDLGMSWGSVLENMGNYVQLGMKDIIKAIDDMLENNGLPTMREMLDDFGQAFGDTLSSIAEAIPGIVDEIMGFVDKIREWKGVLDEVKGHFEPFRDAFMNAFSNLLESFGPIWESLKGLFESLEPILMALGIIVGSVLVGAFGIFYGVLSGVISAIGPFIAALINAVDFVVEFVLLVVAVLTLDFPAALEIWNSMTETAISFFTNLWDGVINFFSSFIETIVGFFKGLYDTLVGNSIIPDMVNAILDWIGNLVDSFISLVTGLVDSVVGFFGDLYTRSVQTVTNMVTGVVNKYTEMKDQAIQRAQEILSNVIQKFQEIKTNIQNKITEAKTALVNKFSEMVSGARNKATEIVTTARTKFEEVKGAIRDKLTEAVTTVSTKIGEMPGKVTEKVTDMISAGKDLISGLISGIKNMGKDAIEAVTGVVDGVIGKAKSLLKIKSPSKLFEEFGGYLSEGLSIGISKDAKEAFKSSESLAKGVSDAFQTDINGPSFINRLRGVSTPEVALGTSKIAYSPGNYTRTANQPRDRVLVIKPSNVEMDGRKVGEITWEVVDENIERNKDILDRFRG